MGYINESSIYDRAAVNRLQDKVLSKYHKDSLYELTSEEIKKAMNWCKRNVQSLPDKKELKLYYDFYKILYNILNGSLYTSLSDNMYAELYSKKLNESIVDDIMQLVQPEHQLCAPQERGWVQLGSGEVVPQLDDYQPQVSEMPELGDSIGVANIILDMLTDEIKSILGYNNLIANLEGYEEMIPIIQDIANEENNHIGMLQELLAIVSPNAETIKRGESEAEQQLLNRIVVVESLLNEGSVGELGRTIASGIGNAISDEVSNGVNRLRRNASTNLSSGGGHGGGFGGKNSASSGQEHSSGIGGKNSGSNDLTSTTDNGSSGNYTNQKTNINKKLVQILGTMREILKYSNSHVLVDCVWAVVVTILACIRGRGLVKDALSSITKLFEFVKDTKLDIDRIKLLEEEQGRIDNLNPYRKDNAPENVYNVLENVLDTLEEYEINDFNQLLPKIKELTKDARSVLNELNKSRRSRPSMNDPENVRLRNLYTKLWNDISNLRYVLYSSNTKDDIIGTLKEKQRKIQLNQTPQANESLNESRINGLPDVSNVVGLLDLLDYKTGDVISTCNEAKLIMSAIDEDAADSLDDITQLMEDLNSQIIELKGSLNDDVDEYELYDDDIGLNYEEEDDYEQED